jgi:hypothetical protein
MEDRYIYRHKKTGKHYRVYSMDIINCTNANDDQIMVWYKDKVGNKSFVREKQEFLERFELTEFHDLEFFYGDMFDNEGYLVLEDKENGK